MRITPCIVTDVESVFKLRPYFLTATRNSVCVFEFQASSHVPARQAVAGLSPIDGSFLSSRQKRA